MDLDVVAETGKSKTCGCSHEEGTAPAAPARDDTRNGTGPDRRLDRVERRMGIDRRTLSAKESGHAGPERRKPDNDRRTGLERRRGPGRRLSDDRKSAEEGEMSDHQFEFVMAVQTYKKVNKKMYPTWTEILEIVNQLGYRKVVPRKLRLDAPEPELTEVPPAKKTA